MGRDRVLQDGHPPIQIRLRLELGGDLLVAARALLEQRLQGLARLRIAAGQLVQRSGAQLVAAQALQLLQLGHHLLGAAELAAGVLEVQRHALARQHLVDLAQPGRVHGVLDQVAHGGASSLAADAGIVEHEQQRREHLSRPCALLSQLRQGLADGIQALDHFVGVQVQVGGALHRICQCSHVACAGPGGLLQLRRERGSLLGRHLQHRAQVGRLPGHAAQHILHGHALALQLVHHRDVVGRAAGHLGAQALGHVQHLLVFGARLAVAARHGGAQLCGGLVVGHEGLAHGAHGRQHLAAGLAQRLAAIGQGLALATQCLDALQPLGGRCHHLALLFHLGRGGADVVVQLALVRGQVARVHAGAAQAFAHVHQARSLRGAQQRQALFLDLGRTQRAQHGARGLLARARFQPQLGHLLARAAQPCRGVCQAAAQRAVVAQLGLLLLQLLQLVDRFLEFPGRVAAGSAQQRQGLVHALGLLEHLVQAQGVNGHGGLPGLCGVGVGWRSWARGVQERGERRAMEWRWCSVLAQSWLS